MKKCRKHGIGAVLLEAAIEDFPAGHHMPESHAHRKLLYSSELGERSSECAPFEARSKFSLTSSGCTCGAKGRDRSKRRSRPSDKHKVMKSQEVTKAWKDVSAFLLSQLESAIKANYLAVQGDGVPKAKVDTGI